MEIKSGKSLENRLNDLPLEILERIFKLVLASSTYEFLNHVANNYNSLIRGVARKFLKGG